jgi:hypothetical protein
MTTKLSQRFKRIDWRALTQRPLLRLSAVGLTLAMVLVSWSTWTGALEQRALFWLQERQNQAQDVFGLAYAPSQMDALTEPQARVVSWLSRKYRVAPEPLSAIVIEAFELGAAKGLDPALILSVAANESRFNPLAQSPVGAQGLMQVLTRVHTEKFEAHGGTDQAFEPLTNLRVGSKILQDSIRRAGSVEGGLRQYVGAVKTDGRDYIEKVVAEQLRLRSVMAGKSTPFQTIPDGMPDFSLPEPELVATTDDSDI